jgi:hypothetical protein
VPEADTHAARIAAELARRYPASFNRLSARLRPGTRRRLLQALNMDADAAGASGVRRGLSPDAVHAWREGAAAAAAVPPGGRRGARQDQQQPQQPRRRDDEPQGSSEFSDDDDEEEEEEEEEEEDDGRHDDHARSQAEFEALAAVAREWEAAELTRAKEEDAKDLATMMRLCCIAMKPSGERARAAAPPPPPRTKLAGRAPAQAPAASPPQQQQQDGEGRDRRRRAPRS